MVRKEVSKINAITDDTNFSLAEEGAGKIHVSGRVCDNYK